MNTAFILSKCRVIPIKGISTPKGELQAAVVAVQYLELIKNSIRVEISDTFFWTDATTVLKFLRNETTRFERYVANRIAYIRSKTQISQWNYCPSELNMADDLSRAQCLGSSLFADKIGHSNRTINGRYLRRV